MGEPIGNEEEMKTPAPLSATVTDARARSEARCRDWQYRESEGRGPRIDGA
jgi:hypothetical protein